MLNMVILQGRLAADPEHRQTQGGISAATFRIACERSYQPKGGERETDFIPCKAWRGTADFICKYFARGDMILLQGSLQSRNYTDRDGNRRTAWEVNVESVNFCQAKPGGNHGEGSGEPQRGAPHRQSAAFPSPDDFEEVDEDDSNLPF